VINEKALRRVSDADRKILDQHLEQAVTKIDEANLQDNQNAMTAILNQGLQLVPVEELAREEIDAIRKSLVIELEAQGIVPAL
jgi:TRAP-type C4-dicarboxylate transport system substrate-binding protein